MQLTPQDGIRPGIYRTSLSYLNSVPGIGDQTGRTSVAESLESVAGRDAIHGTERISPDNKKRTFFPKVGDFFETWREGYRKGASQFGESQVYNKLGFELFYVNWKPGSDFFKIGNHEGVKMMGGTRPDINPIMIAGDNNGMNDQRDYLNLGVSDFRTQKVLVFREEDIEERKEPTKTDLTPKTPKKLRDDIHYYLWDGPDRFPLEPPNNLKSTEHVWTAVGISPLEIYKEIEKMGFIFPI